MLANPMYNRRMPAPTQPRSIHKPAHASPAHDNPARQARKGHGKVTMRDVAAAADVTAITVSRYLSDPDVVAPDTATRIRAAIASTGYVPNRQAGLLASGVSNMVAALLPNLANSIFAETAQGLSTGLQAAGRELMIASTNYSLEREEELLRALLGWRPAAVVVTGRRHSAAAQALLAQAQSGGMPVIEIWDHHAAARGGPAFTQIGFDHDDVGRAMAQHLLDAGHQRLAYVDSGVAADYRAHERGIAFADYARAAGAQVVVIVAPAGDLFDAGRQVLAALAKRGPKRVTAAAFANDNLACGAMLEASRQQIKVPAQLAILGFGDFAIARQLEPALSSVHLPRLEIGLEAARSLLEALGGGKPAASLRLPWALVARASTAAR